MSAQELINRLEDLLDQLELVAKEFRDAIDTLEEAPDEAPEPLECDVDVPYDDFPPDMPNTLTEKAYAGSIDSFTKYTVQGFHGTITTRNVSDVELFISGEVDTINILSSSRLVIRGSGSVGTIHVQSKSDNLSFSDLRMYGNASGYAFNFNGGGSNITIEKIQTACDAYSIWAEKLENVSIEDCSFVTLDRNNGNDEAVTRFVNCKNVSIKNTTMNSNLKHCFRIHEISSNFSLVNCVFEGDGNGVMLGGMGEDVSNVSFVSCRFLALGPDLLNVDEKSVDLLTLDTCEFVLRHGWDPVQHVVDNVSGTYLNITKKIV